MSVKNGVMMPVGKQKSVQAGVSDKLLIFRRKMLRLYLQYVNPKLAKTTEVVKEPNTFLKKLLPVNMGLWLAVAAAVTGILVFTMPEPFWVWQIALFLTVFLLGPMFFRLLKAVQSIFVNLLVAYPGKHLLNEEITLDSAIVDGSAEVMLHGESWELRGDDCPVGTHVTVIAIKENILFVATV